jgi:dolichyl-phosphate-mannose-protein mannosyltransferase
MATESTDQKSPIDKTAFQDEPFDFIEDKGKIRFPAIFWLQWGLLFLFCFYFASIFAGGFSEMHQYGVDEASGQNSVFHISSPEKIFFAALLICLPAALFLTLFAEKFIKPEFMNRLKWFVDPNNSKKVVGAMMAVAAIAIILVAFLILDRSPISDDENVYGFQTRILAQGKLTLESKPDNDSLFEDNIFLVNNGKIFGQYPFGHSMILLPGYLLGIPRISQMLAAILTILGVFLLGRELYGNRVGIFAAGLVTISPMFIYTSATLLSHTNTMFFLAWFGYFAVKTVREKNLLYPILCGLAFGAAFHIRGATTMLIAIPAALVLAFIMLRHPKQNLLKIVLLGATVGGTVGSYLALNWYVNGDPFYTNYHAAWMGKTRFDSPFGFGKGAWRIVHSPSQGFVNGINNLVKLNGWLFGWPVGFLFVGIWAARKGRKWVDGLLILPVVVTFVAYFFYFWPGISDTGPVLYFELLLPVALLTAKGMEAAPGWLSRWMPESQAVLRTTIFILISTVIGFATFDFFTGAALAKLPDRVSEPYDEMMINPTKKTLIFVDYYFKETGQQSWVAGRTNTHPDLGDNVLYALNYGRDKNEKYHQTYLPEYEAYVFYYKNNEAVIVPLADYEVRNLLKNYPDSR